MYCDSCGAALQAGQSFCPRCGKAVAGGFQPAPSRVARHGQLLGILWIAYSALLVLASLFIIIFFQRFFPLILQHQPPAGGPPPEFVLGFIVPMMHVIGIVLLVKSVLGVLAGIGILNRADWSRMLAIVLGCISLLSMPFGTALGVYTLWVLLSPNAVNEFSGQG